MNLEQARVFVWEHLRALRNYPAPVQAGTVGIDRAVAALARAVGIAPDWNGGSNILQGYDSVNVRAVLSELVTAGVLVWGHDALQSDASRVQLTEFGLQCLQEGAINAYDPNGYLREVITRTPGLDPVARAYLEEAVTCLQRACYRACAVMLGGASETVMLRVIEAFRDALQPGPRKAAFVAGAIDPVSIARRVAFFRGELQSIKRSIPQPLRDNLDIRLDGIFSLIRMARNDAGHPNPASGATRDAAHGHLLLFPSYCATAYELIDHLNSHPIP